MTDFPLNPQEAPPADLTRSPSLEKVERRPRLDPDVYRDARRQHSEMLANTCKTLDQAMLTLPAGALALSMTFIKDIAQNPKESWLLLQGWYGFGAALLITLISLATSQRSSLSDIADLDAGQKGEGRKDGRNLCSYATECLNYIAILAFVFGLYQTAEFAALNMR